MKSIIKSKNLKLEVFLLCIVLFIISFIYPVNVGLKRLAVIIFGVLSLLSLFILIQKRKKLRIAYVSVLVIIAIIMMLNGKKISPDEMRSEYINVLKSYEGTRYVWGGEGRLGVDCSGLIRKALIDTNIKLGLENLSQQYIRRGIYLWFNDFSAQAVRDGYKHLAIKVCDVENLRIADYSKINQGDVAVTESGAHIIAYIGNRKWIEADPYEKKVIVINANDINNILVNSKFRVLRLSELDNGDPINYKIVYNEIFQGHENLIKAFKKTTKVNSTGIFKTIKNKIYFTYIYSPKYTDAKVLIDNGKPKVKFYYSWRRRKKGVLIRISSDRRIKKNITISETDNRVNINDNYRTNSIQIGTSHIILPKGSYICDTHFTNSGKFFTVLESQKVKRWIEFFENSKVVESSSIKSKINSENGVSFINLESNDIPSFSLYTFRNNKENLGLTYIEKTRSSYLIKHIYIKSPQLIKELNREANFQ